MRHLDFTLSLIDKLTRPVKQAQSTLTGFAEKSQASFTRIGIGTAALWGVAQSIKSVVGPAYEMNAALSQVASKGVAEDTLKRLSSEALKLSVRYGKSAIDIVNSSYAMKGALVGLADQDLPRVTIAANTLAAGVRASGEEAGTYLGAMAARFSTELESLGHVRFTEELAGKTAYMVQNFGVSMQNMQELIEGTKNAGADFGVSMNEQFAVLGELSRTMGTESSGMYEQFLRSAPAAAQKLGMSFVDATGKILPMGDILQKIQAKFGTNIAGNVKAQQKLDEAFGGGADVIKKLIDRQDQLNKSVTELGRNDGMKRAQEMAERMADPWERLTAVWYSMRVAIGNTLLPVITPLINRLTAAGETFARWLEMFPNIARWIGYITVGILALGAAGAVIGIVAGLFSLLSSPIILIIAALGILAWAVYDQYKYWSWAFGEIGKDLKALWGQIVSVWGSVGKWFSGIWSSIQQGWRDVVSYIATLSPVEALISLVASIGAAFLDLSGRITTIWDGVVSFFSGVWESIALGWEMVVNFFSTMSPLAAFEGFAETIGGVFNRLFDVLKNTFAASYNWIVEKLNKIPGVNIDLKPTVAPVNSLPAPASNIAGAVNSLPAPASNIAGQVSNVAPLVPGGQSLLAGNKVGDSIPRQGLMGQVSKESKTSIDQRRSYGDINFLMPNGMTPAQLAEWQEMDAG